MTPLGSRRQAIVGGSIASPSGGRSGKRANRPARLGERANNERLALAGGLVTDVDASASNASTRRVNIDAVQPGIGGMPGRAASACVTVAGERQANRPLDQWYLAASSRQAWRTRRRNRASRPPVAIVTVALGLRRAANEAASRHGKPAIVSARPSLTSRLTGAGAPRRPSNQTAPANGAQRHGAGIRRAARPIVT